jgi:pimeloyl-ACP methyl ester carboxylesterase
MKTYSTLFIFVFLTAPVFCFTSQESSLNKPDSKTSLLAPGEHYASILEKYVPFLKDTLSGTGLSLWAHDNWWKSEQLHPMPQSVNLHLVQAKTLILVGREDPECPVVMSETIHSGILGSKLIIFEKTGHFPWIESREKFFSVVSQFLTQ